MKFLPKMDKMADGDGNWKNTTPTRLSKAKQGKIKTTELTDRVEVELRVTDRQSVNHQTCDVNNMHGRIKVRTTAQQQEAKRKEQEKKLKIYSKTTGKIFAKRKNGDLDDEALQLTEAILGANPDFSTMWNFRREIFMKMKDERVSEQMQELCKKELSFLKSCLGVNPKSYGVWHHREWVMDFMPIPDWSRELELCNLFLTYDERNFHCWDYRRFVVTKAKVTPEQEFKFSTEKIKENFSNYSSWHYRSKLLPQIHPDTGGDVERVEEEALMKEFELAQNAFFTDPYDQSAWFYHRWLLGRARQQLDITCLYARVFCGKLHVILRFTQLVQIMEYDPRVTADITETPGEWHSPLNSGCPSHVWFFTGSLYSACEFIFVSLNDLTFKKDNEQKIEVSLQEGKFQRNVLLGRDTDAAWNLTSESNMFRAELTAVHSSVLENELDSCNLLLEEEPDNKWTMLTMVLLMRALNPLKFEADTEKYLNKLSQVDHYRKEYYRDLGRKFRLENAIEKHREKAGNFKEFEHRKLNLKEMGLTFLCHMDQLLLVTDLDLSSNKLSSLDECNFLQCLRNLNASDNQIDRITTRGSLSLHSLEEVYLQNNRIANFSALSSLQGCGNLLALDLRGNPVCEREEYRLRVKTLIPSLKTLDGEEY